MISIGVEVFVALGPVDMRFGMERLGGLVRATMGREPRSRAMFVFINKRRTMIKVLSWVGTGMALWHKKLDQGLFQVPRATRADATSVVLSEAAFEALFAGLSTDARSVH